MPNMGINRRPCSTRLAFTLLRRGWYAGGNASVLTILLTPALFRNAQWSGYFAKDRSDGIKVSVFHAEICHASRRRPLFTSVESEARRLFGVEADGIHDHIRLEEDP